MATMEDADRQTDGLVAVPVRLGNAHYRRMRSLLLRAFPPEERVPASLLALNALRRPVRLLAFYDGDVFAGFLNACFTDRMVYALYLAVNDEVRSRGYGSRILAWLKAEAGARPVALEIEMLDDAAPNAEQRERRLRFYERNGFSDTGYLSIDGKCTYTVLSTIPAGEEFPADDLRRTCRTMFAHLMAPRIKKR